MSETEATRKSYNEYDNFSFHPYNVLLTLVLFGITVLFLSFSAAFLYTRVQSELPPVRLPAIFIFNSFFLLGSSATMIWAKRSFQADHTRNYQRALVATILLSLAFLMLQFLGWRSLFQREIFLSSSNAASYLYVISGLHFAHVIAGLPFLALFLSKALRQMKEPVSVLVYFSDPEKRLKLRLLALYWHFIDGLWIYLVLFFWINYLIGI